MKNGTIEERVGAPGTVEDPLFAAAGEGGAVDLSSLRIALVHDFLYTYAGAERVLGEMLEVVPQADVFSLFDFLPEKERHFLMGKRVQTSFLQRMPMARRKHRSYLPLMPLAAESLDMSGYDLVISSSYLTAKGVITGPHQLHMCYCHSPARFAWDQQQQYLSQSGLLTGLRGILAKLVLHYIRNWDVRSANGVDIFLSNSQFVRQRIEKVYRRDATPIYPPVDVDRFKLQPIKEDFYVTASRLVPYKRVDLVVEAFSRMPDRKLVVIGEGPELAKIRKLAAGNVEIMGHQPHAVMADLMGRARGFVFAAEEDFGISPVEAQACGTPVIAFGRGGVTETVVSGKTGLFFPRQTVESLMLAVDKVEHHGWDPIAIRKHAEQFSREAFQRSFRREVMTAMALFQHRRGQSGPGDARRGREMSVRRDSLSLAK
jgi:glycosyltransferase involved in cell wall biosynthesis